MNMEMYVIWLFVKCDRLQEEFFSLWVFFSLFLQSSPPVIPYLNPEQRGHNVGDERPEYILSTPSFLEKIIQWCYRKLIILDHFHWEKTILGWQGLWVMSLLFSTVCICQVCELLQLPIPLPTQLNRFPLPTHLLWILVVCGLWFMKIWSILVYFQISEHKALKSILFPYSSSAESLVIYSVLCLSACVFISIVLD